MEDKKNVSFAALKLIDLTIKDHAKQLQKKKQEKRPKSSFTTIVESFFSKQVFSQNTNLQENKTFDYQLPVNRLTTFNILSIEIGTKNIYGRFVRVRVGEEKSFSGN